jgi:hypothetical protein
LLPANVICSLLCTRPPKFGLRHHLTYCRAHGRKQTLSSSWWEPSCVDHARAQKLLIALRLGSDADHTQVILAGLAFLTFRTSSDVHHVLVIDSGSTGTRMYVTAHAKSERCRQKTAELAADSLQSSIQVERKPWTSPNCERCCATDSTAERQALVLVTGFLHATSLHRLHHLQGFAKHAQHLHRPYGHMSNTQTGSTHSRE